MRKLKAIWLTLALGIISMTSIAQPPAGGKGNHQRSEKIKAMKVEYITTKLDLTPSEAEKFWPLYNAFNDKMMELERTRRRALRDNANKEMTDKEVNDFIAFNFKTDQDILDLRKEYDAKFKEVLGIQKVGKLYQAEDQFRHEMLRKMKGAGGPPPPPNN